MTEMSITRAFEIFGLKPGATSAEIEQRFRMLASEKHPDHGGSAEEFTEVITARDRLQAGADAGDLVRLGTGDVVLTPSAQADLAVVERRRLVVQEQQENSERVTKGLVRAEVSKLTRNKRRASFLGLLGGGTAALTLVLRATDSTAERYLEFAWIAPVLIGSVALGAVCAIGGFAISDQISRIEQAIEDAAETMSSRATFLDLLYELIDVGEIDNLDNWTTSELAGGVDTWSRVNARGSAHRRRREASLPPIMRIPLLPLGGIARIGRWFLAGRFDSTPSLADLAAVIGPEGFTRLLIAKGEETGLLVATEEVDDGRLLVIHKLVIEPANKVAGTPAPTSS
jgi:hypothetical protein